MSRSEPDSSTGGVWRKTHPTGVLDIVREKCEAGNRDLLAGGISVMAVADELDVEESTARHTLDVLADNGELVRVDGVAPEPPYWPRKSYLPPDIYAEVAGEVDPVQRR